jgi:hypothetical protein
MMVTNHFDVRWVDGYSAVSDVPSSLAAVIEKLAADLPSSGDRIELGVRDVRRSDGTTTWVGLLRFVVAVSSAPRPLGFLHAAVMPTGYRIDVDGWRAVVERRYGAHPEDRIRTLYEELAESTKDIGRDRLHALAIRPEDVREQLVPFDEADTPPSIPRTYTRPGSRPPKGIIMKSAPPASAPPKRSSQPVLPLSVRVVNLPEPSPAPSDVEDLPDEQEIANDVTQPMDAPSGTAAPLSGEHPQHRPVARARWSWWGVGTAGALALLLGAMGWLAHRHVVLIEDRDRLIEELSRRYPDQTAWERDRAELLQVKRELEERRSTDKHCNVQIEAATKECKASLNDYRSLARANGDRVEQFREEVRLRTNELLDANSKYSRLKNDLTAAATSREETERLFREEKQRAHDREAENKRLRAKLVERDEQLRVFSKCLQSARGGEKPPPKECLAIK